MSLVCVHLFWFMQQWSFSWLCHWIRWFYSSWTWPVSDILSSGACAFVSLVFWIHRVAVTVEKTHAMLAVTEVALNYTIAALKRLKRKERQEEKSWIWTLTVVFWVTVRPAKGLQLLSCRNILVKWKEDEDDNIGANSFVLHALQEADSRTYVAAMSRFASVIK